MSEKEQTTAKQKTEDAQQADVVVPEDEIKQAEAADTTESAEPADGDLRLQVLATEVQKNKDGWQRTLAEFQNYKRRTEREQKELRERVKLETIGEFLPVIDDFERALENMPDDQNDHPWIKGTQLILGKLKKILADHEVTAVDPIGEPFDPNYHQAIAMDDSDEYESGHVMQTLQKGYACGEIMIRPAVVRVAN